MPSVVRIHLRPHDIAEVAQLIEHQPSKLRVASLSLVFRSKNNKEGVSAGCILFLGSIHEDLRFPGQWQTQNIFPEPGYVFS